MGHPVVHFEIIGKDAKKLRSFYGDLFGWEFDTSAPVAEAISQPGNYGFVNRNPTSDGTGIPVGWAEASTTTVTSSFTSAFPNVEAALRKAESLGGARKMGPEMNPGAELVVAHFTDPEGHLIGLAGPR